MESIGSYEDIGSLKEWDQNPRYNQEAVDKVALSIKRFGFASPIIVRSEDRTIICGHTRFLAAQQIGLTQVPVRFMDLDPTEAQLLALADNRIGEIADWNEQLLGEILRDLREEDLSSIGFSDEELTSFIDDLDSDIPNDFEEYRPDLYERFLMPPFSVIDSSNGQWQKRKKHWKQYFSSNEGRGKCLINDSPLMQQVDGGTSIFDPVLCEVVYTWFSSEDALVLDPFAGGSVRGLMAAFLNRNYIGLDIREEQIEENVAQHKEQPNISKKVEWIHANSENIDLHVNEQADLIFTCPPYFDLEVYSDLKEDLSNKSFEEFLVSYQTIIEKSCQLLKDDRFAVVVIGDIRDNQGMYRNIVSKTIEYFLEAGLSLYNEIILKTALATVPLRAARPFKATRKVCKCHQNILVFLKGDPHKATDFCGEVSIIEEVIDG